MIEQQISFCTAPDGTRLAYAEYGPASGASLVVFGGYNIGQESVWSLPDGRAFLEDLGSMRRLITFDYRGLGGSQRDVGSNDRDVDLADLTHLADHLRLTEFDLFAIWPDGATYAARHPEKIRRLILWMPSLTNPAFPAETLAMIRTSWSLYTRALATVIYPGAPPEALRWISDALRRSCTADYYASTVSLSHDYRPEFPRVRCPTLVLHPIDNKQKSVEEGREVAALIPGAKFVAVNAGCWLPYWDRGKYMETVRGFLTGVRSEGSAVPSGTRTVLFTDIVGHTAMMQRLGDTKGRDVLREHERITREVLRAHGGAEVKTMGDGFMASFVSATKAVDCAIALQRAFAAHTDSMPEPLHVRVGVNAGEPIEEDGDLFGATVILASRIAASAGAGEILVPDTVRGLLSGKGFIFGDRGEFVPKGFDDAVRLFEVRWRD